MDLTNSRFFLANGSQSAPKYWPVSLIDALHSIYGQLISRLTFDHTSFFAFGCLIYSEGLS